MFLLLGYDATGWLTSQLSCCKYHTVPWEWCFFRPSFKLLRGWIEWDHSIILAWSDCTTVNCLWDFSTTYEGVWYLPTADKRILIVWYISSVHAFWTLTNTSPDHTFMTIIESFFVHLMHQEFWSITWLLISKTTYFSVLLNFVLRQRSAWIYFKPFFYLIDSLFLLRVTPLFTV